MDVFIPGVVATLMFCTGYDNLFITIMSTFLWWGLTASVIGGIISVCS